MKRLLEWMIGLDRGFLDKEGEFSIQFHPKWPGQEALDHMFTKIGFGPIGAEIWNLSLIAVALMLVIYVYRKEGRSRAPRISLGVIRCLILGFIIALLNMPVLTNTQSRTEPSVLAILIDDSVSMRVKDVVPGGGGATPGVEPISRIDAAMKLLKDDDLAVVKALSKTHILRFYRFNRQSIPLLSLTQEKKDENAKDDSGQPEAVDYQPLIKAMDAIKAEGQTTQVLTAIKTAIEDIQGQRVAGVVVLSDVRSSPKEAIPETMAIIKGFGFKIFPVGIGSDKPPRNLTLESINVQDAAFQGDIVNIKATVRGIGFGPGYRVRLTAIDKKTKLPLRRADGRPVDREVVIDEDKPIEAELQWKPDKVENVDIEVIAQKEPAEIDDGDNSKETTVAVLDAKINVLYVDGYPRWEYRYIKNEMIRDATVRISCLLTSADPTFAQEGDQATEDFPGPVKRFPESIEEIMKYDVVIFGDVDPRQFTDAQLQLVKDFVSKRGGGFGLIAGPRHAPAQFKDSAISELLPVDITNVDDSRPKSVKEGWRLVLTKAGQESSIFRFFEDKDRNAKFLRDEIQPVFWYARGIKAKRDMAEVYAHHPSEVDGNGKPAPVLVLGRFGAGRTLFSGIDDSWRWRFYTGESIFDTYWIQQFRYLARSKKLGQRKMTFTVSRSIYELGAQVEVNLRVLDPQLLSQLPDSIPVEISDNEGKVAYSQNMVKQEGQIDLYSTSYTADKLGKFRATLPDLVGGVAKQELFFEVNAPRLELNQPQVDRTLLTRLASETMGQAIEYGEAKTKLAAAIPSAAKQIPVDDSEPLWNKDRALWIFVLLITLEWVLRKVYGML